MKILFLSILSFLCIGCGHKVMTNTTFYEIRNDISTDELIQIAGKPYTIRRKGNCIEYEYIERIKNGNYTIQENHYFFVIKNNHVCSRRIEYVNPPPYSINSYDLQTSYSEEEGGIN